MLPQQIVAERVSCNFGFSAGQPVFKVRRTRWASLIESWIVETTLGMFSIGLAAKAEIEKAAQERGHRRTAEVLRVSESRVHYSPRAPSGAIGRYARRIPRRRSIGSSQEVWTFAPCRRSLKSSTGPSLDRHCGRRGIGAYAMGELAGYDETHGPSGGR